MKKGGCVLIFFALFWSAITLTFDSFIGHSVFKSVMAKNFASTQGTILSSEVTRHTGSKSTTYGFGVSYSYRVNGQPYTGDRYRYDRSSSSDSAWAQAAVRDYPAGSQAVVFYDPNNPAESVLKPGVQGSDLFMALFMAPFNVVMIGIWWIAFNQGWQRWRKPIAGGVKIRVSLQETRVNLSSFSPIAVTLASWGGLAFISIFVIGFAGGGFHPSIPVAGATWLVILLGGIGIGCWNWRNTLRGKYDLVIDELNGTLRLPVGQGRKVERTLSRAEVENVFVETIAKTASKGGTTYYFAPTLRLGSSPGGTEKLAEWLDETKAQSFADWLRAKLNLSGDDNPGAKVFPAPMRPPPGPV